METIDERQEQESNESRRDGNLHPLLDQKILSRLLTFFGPSELKTARLVCDYWRSAATPVLMKKTVVNLQGICSICHSPFQNERAPPPPVHDHRRTVSFYRFVSLLQVLYPRDREKIHFRNFKISNINLYFIPRVNTEPTKYFQMFVKLFGEKVQELYLESVQICPSDSIPKFLSMFKNLEIVHFEKSSLWMDPAEKKKITSEAESKPPKFVAPPEEWLPHFFLKKLSLGPDLVTEKFLNWEKIFDLVPGLQELCLRDFTYDEINKCLEALNKMPDERFKQMILTNLVIYPRGHTNHDVPIVIPATPSSATGSEKTKSIENGSTETAPSAELENTVTLLSMAITKLSQLRDLTLKIEYTQFDCENILPLFQNCCDKLNSLTLDRPFSVLGPETELVFQRGLFETPTDNAIVFPYVKKLKIVHNFIDSFEEIKQSFPLVDTLYFKIAATEILLRDRRPYHTYLKTNALVYMRNSAPLPFITHLIWDIEDVRHKKTKFRTIVYKTSALRHVSKIFPHLTRLTVSITRPADLHVIFQDLPLLEELAVLKNSLYRTKDAEIIGELETEALPTVENGKANGMPPVKSKGIRQLKHLQRLSLENNNCCLTNESVRNGFVHLSELRSLHVNNGTKLTLSGLRYLRKCRYLAFVNIVKPKRPPGKEEPPETEVEPPSAPKLPPLITIPDKYTFKGKTKIPKSVNPPRRIVTKRIAIPVSPSPSLVNVSSKGSLPILISSYTPTVEEIESGLHDIKSFGRLHSPSLLALPPILPMNAKTGKVDYRTALMTDEALDIKEILSLSEAEPARKQLETFILDKSRVPVALRQPKNKIPYSEKKAYGYRSQRFLNSSTVKTKLKNYEPGSAEGFGGRKFGFVKTFYKVNGRTYQLYRRRYETDGDKEKFIENYRTWRRKKRAGFVPELPKEVLLEAVGPAENIRESDAEGSESEYERSIKDYDEDEEVEEYVDDEFEKENFRVHVPTTSDSYESDSSHKGEAIYEGDKEFYDEEFQDDESDDLQLHESSSEFERQRNQPSRHLGKRLTFASDVPLSAALVETQKRKSKRKHKDGSEKRERSHKKKHKKDGKEKKERSRSRSREKDPQKALKKSERKRVHHSYDDYSSMLPLEIPIAPLSPNLNPISTAPMLINPSQMSPISIALPPEIRIVSPRSLTPQCQRRSACCLKRSSPRQLSPNPLPSTFPYRSATPPTCTSPPLLNFQDFPPSFDAMHGFSSESQSDTPTTRQRKSSPYSDSDLLESIPRLYSPLVFSSATPRLSPKELTTLPMHQHEDPREVESSPNEHSDDSGSGSEYEEVIVYSDEEPSWPSEWPSEASSRDSAEAPSTDNEENYPDLDAPPWYSDAPNSSYFETDSEIEKKFTAIHLSS